MRRRTAVLLLIGLAGAAPGVAGAAGPGPLHCLTPIAGDGHEPPCNPYQASAEWGTNHRSSYAQGSSPYPAPRPGDDVRWQDLQFGNEVPVILQFGAPYPDGRRTVWLSTVGSPETKAVYKLDAATGERIGRATILDEGGTPGQTTTSGVYNLLTRENHLITVRADGFAVYGDARPGESGSPIRLLGGYRLPARAFCRTDDRIIGITLTYGGELAFATVRGMVGVLPRDPAAMGDDTLAVASINGSRCADPAVPTAELEEVANSIAADENGGIYVVSTKAQYRFDRRATGLVQRWRAAYPTGGGGGGTTLSSGSGSTPDLVGTHPGDDRFVVITDGQSLMHVTYFWRDEIPENWRPIAPGYDRRIACSAPVRFGNPAATESISEQSVLTRGYSAIVVNNALPLDDAFTLLPPDRRPLSTLTSNLPGNQPRGMERIDWDPRTRTCRSVWANPDVSIPNAIPTLSTDSGLIYGVGVRNTVFGLEGLDFATGKPKLWEPTSPLPTENSFFAATTIGPAGDVWVGGTSGISVFRGPDREPPRMTCRDLTAPSSRVTAAGRSRVRVLARDTACGTPAAAADLAVSVSIARLERTGCRHVLANGRLGRRGSCASRSYYSARRTGATMSGRGARFELKLGDRLPRGTYRVLPRALDLAGNAEAAARARIRAVRVSDAARSAVARRSRIPGP